MVKIMLFTLPTIAQIKFEATLLQKKSQIKLKRKEALHKVARKYDAPNWNTLFPNLKNIIYPQKDIKKLFETIDYHQSEKIEKGVVILKDKENTALGIAGRLYLFRKQEKVKAYFTEISPAFSSSYITSTFAQEFTLTELPNLDDKVDFMEWWTGVFKRHVISRFMEQKKRIDTMNSIKIGDYFYGHFGGTFWQVSSFNNGKVELMKVESKGIDESYVPTEHRLSHKLINTRIYHILEKSNPVMIKNIVLLEPTVNEIENDYEVNFYLSIQTRVGHYDLLIPIRKKLPFYWHPSISANLEQGIEVC